MFNIDILKEIEQRTAYLFPLSKKYDTVFDNIPSDKEYAVIITTERKFAFRLEAKYKNLNGYFISGIFDLGKIYRPSTDLRFSMYILSKEVPATVKVAYYQGPDYQRRRAESKRNQGNSAIRLYQPPYYPDEFMDFKSDLEDWLNNEKAPGNSHYGMYNEVSYSEYDASKPYSKRYLAQTINIIRRLQEETTVYLGDYAFIHDPSNYPVCEEEVKYLYHEPGDPITYPLEDKDFRVGHPMQFELMKGDIIGWSLGDVYEFTFISEDLPQKTYCPTNVMVIRPDEDVSPEFLFLYLNSNVCSVLIDYKVHGEVIKDLGPLELCAIPIPRQNNPSDFYRRRFQQLYYKQSDLDFFGDCYRHTLSDTIEDILNEELTQKALQCRDAAVRELIKADIEEIKKCVSAGAYKSALIMAGSVLEAFLTDWLIELNSEHKRFRKKKNILKLDLCGLIKNIEDLKVPKWMDAGKATNIRKRRNLVHAKLCIKEGTIINAELCEEVIHDLAQIIHKR